MKITIIAPSSFGYIDFLVEGLEQKPNVEVMHINFSSFKYRYKSVFDKLNNLIKKTFLRVNVKDQYRSEQILKTVAASAKQDYIVVIRPDQVEVSTLKQLKQYANSFYAFYFDAIAKFPKKIDLIPLFDKVYSYEKDDVKTYDLEFITNFIYDTEKLNDDTKDFEVYNISSYDERFSTLENIADYLKTKDISYKIEVRKESTSSDGNVTIIPDYKTISEVKQQIFRANIMLDIQKEGQKGLSFRVFEALGYDKKLISTNKDVVSYDFYNPNNICVVDADAIAIPDDFFNSTYQPVDKSILYKYTLDGWIEKVFNI